MGVQFPSLPPGKIDDYGCGAGFVNRRSTVVNRERLENGTPPILKIGKRKSYAGSSPVLSGY